jgi:hypothetical protein
MMMDQERVKALATEILGDIRDHYLRGPAGRDRVYEALNALAFTAATILHGVDSPAGAEECTQFFEKALSVSLQNYSNGETE